MKIIMGLDPTPNTNSMHSVCIAIWYKLFSLGLNLDLHLCRKLKICSLSWENNLPLPLSGQQNRFDEPQPKPNKPNQFQNGNLAICNSVSIVTPEKASFIDLSNSDEELNFNHSAKSSQKRRKMVNSQLAGCTMYSEQYTPQNCTSNYTKDGSNVNVLGVKLRELVQSSLVNKTNKNLKICCKLCRTQLGLAENNLGVLCTQSKMSKVYFAHILKQGDESVGLKNMQVETIVCDMSLINEELVKENKNLGVWSEEDGCVFREVNCLFCPSGKARLGLQVLAANASNVHLINKVLDYFIFLAFEILFCVISTISNNLLLLFFFLFVDKMIFFADSLHTELQQSSEDV